VVYGKRSLARKMPGDDWQRFANLRLLYAFMWAYPGKKLLFMAASSASPTSGATTARWTGRCWTWARFIAVSSS